MQDLSPLLFISAACLGLLGSQAPVGPRECISPVTEQVCECHCSHNVTVEAEVRADTPDSSRDLLWSALVALGGAGLSRCGLVIHLAWLCVRGSVRAVGTLARASWTASPPSPAALEPQAETEIAARVRRDVERARHRSSHNNGGNGGKLPRPEVLPSRRGAVARALRDGRDAVPRLDGDTDA